MRKRTPYRAVAVKDINEERLGEKVKDRRVVFGVDIGKEVPFGALMTEGGEVVATLKWEQPRQTREVVELLVRLPARGVEVALEPSGTRRVEARLEAGDRPK